ncbi:hypothetical protein [Cellulomonas sp.]|uniref:hypothetical protein n=1 Tax=Cellulomonas sp. TaxID=40001 RepID=UPI001B0DBDFF|nr:hypothetical protein [Cellulomonas sp.]MBO9556727.1 hypothetical protein [Cellulomonas sp.]
MPTDLMSYLRRYRPGLTREEAALVCGVSIATLSRRLREGLDADEVLRAARAIGAPPVEALVELGLLATSEVDEATQATSVESAPDRVLLEELLERARERDAVDAADRDEAGLPPAPPARFVPRVVPEAVVSDLHETIADAADDAADWEHEDEERERD